MPSLTLKALARSADIERGHPILDTTERDVRLERVDIDGFGPLSGSFWFPANGVGIWAAPNGSGKTVLIEAIAAGLFGDPDPSRVPSEAEAARAWIMIHLTRDDGDSLVIARDLRGGGVQVTNSRGEDVTAEHREGDRTVGEALLGTTRDEFLEVANLGSDALASTPGNRTLQRMLKKGRGAASSAMSGPSAVPNPSAEAHPPAPTEPPGIDDDLLIVRSAAEELGYVEPGSASELELDSPLDSEVVTNDAPRAAPAPTSPDEPGLNVVERVRRMRSGLARLVGRLEEKKVELKAHSDRVLEYQSETERLGTLTGAEPRDLQQLGELLQEMKRVRDQKEQVRIEEAKFQRELEDRTTSIHRLRELDAQFRGLEATHREFLENYRQSETIRRGNQALIRSESRFEETRLEEIAKARKDGSKLAVYPLGASVLGLAGSLVLQLSPLLGLNPNAFLAFGFLGASTGAFLLWRARDLRDAERQELVTALDRKQDQLEELEKESKYVLGQLHILAEERKIDTSTELLRRFDEWKQYAADISRIHQLGRQLGAVDEQVAKLGEKLATFSAGQDTESDPLHHGAQATEAMYHDYLRFFEVSSALEHAALEATRLEEDLVGIETETADLRETMAEILRTAGVDPERDLDEAIAMFAARHEAGEIENMDAFESLEAHSVDPSPDLGDIAGDTSWMSPLSARVEAIVRRFLPDVREVEVDDKLRPSLKLEARGPRLGYRQLAQHVSAASIDQVCLALRLAIVETLAASGEAIPVFLDDPLTRSDDGRHDQALDFLVTDASKRGQLILLTAQEVRTRWFLHQFPQHQGSLGSLREPSSGGSVSSTSLPSASPSS